MFKHRVISLLLLMAVFFSGQAYSQQETSDPQIRNISGKVTGVDAEGSTFNLQTDMGKMVFYIQAESNLYRFNHHMASIEIQKGDKLDVQYIYASGKNNVIKLVDDTPAVIW